ncbi:PREDICTED: RUN and SH3 domain-containing protein 1 isoform X1 [Cyprinodon variegatus]|uniref:RUN and SH3 domain containing 1 n=1 Tax=Cyprinodon variegatus TaxID=28743 RepID=A0A3Q2DKM1_CYPVA|nr:PREDICTED: RUN and SH3 domain-containing protein 1 isoform X1 [Cyprinodon variegatus]
MMQSSSQAAKPRRFDASRRTANSTGSKLRVSSFQREDKNMNTITNSSPRRGSKAPTASSKSRMVAQPKAPVIQSRLSSQKQGSIISRSPKPKLKSARPSAVTQITPVVAAPPPPLPSALPLDPNCNEPSLPCLCCDGRSPQDNNSMFNHNHNNNNTVSIRQQLQLPPPPPVTQVAHNTGAMVAKEAAPAHAEPPAKSAANVEIDVKKTDKNKNMENKKVDEEDAEEGRGRNVAIDVDEDDDETDSDDDDDDDTLVPSCCDCPPSLLEFSLSSSTSSSSTSISSCSDLESDCADQCASMGSSQDQDHLSAALNPKDHPLIQFPEFKPPSSLPLNNNPFSLNSRSPVASCSPDEGYPSALDSPSPDYLGVKSDSDANKLDLLDFLESVGEFGKMERFSQVIQVARWDLEGEQHWDVLRDRLDHLDRLEKVNREVKLAYVARLHEKGFDLGDLEEQDLSDIMDEMGNIDISWKLSKTRDGAMGESQEFSDAGVDLTAPSDCDDPLVPESLTPSPMELPPRPPKPPARHASVSSDLHTYINISRETTSIAVTTSPTLSTFSPNSSSPTFSTFRYEKSLPPSPPSIPPLPASKPVPYLTLYTTPSPPPSIPTPTPPIPPPRKRHLARKEAQRLAALQAEQEMTPLSLPPPTTRPPPLPPPPVISVSCSSTPPAIPPPPALPPPPSFHALDVEIRKLLMLAGLTQAELLKLSPELGVCVGELEDEEEADNHFTSRSPETREFRFQDGVEERENDTGKVDGDGKASEESNKEGEGKDKQRTTSFSEIARRRKKNTASISDHYYSTTFSNSHEARVNNFPYPNELPNSPPPPPPPRPLPPIPPSSAPLKVSTLPANSEQPERFDWLIAFTPECEPPPQIPELEKNKSTSEIPKKLSSSSSSSDSGPKVTTFKELRFRNKNASPPTKVITDPEPDPTVITPDPDILYNLRWRREKAGSDGSQWEYTSQAQALFMQPPPALTSMAALKEMLQRADKEGGQLELCPTQKIGCSGSDSSLWNVGQERETGELQQEMKERKIEEGKERVEVRGRADGGRTYESRTTVSSPPLSLARSSQPYFLHSTLPPHPPDPRSSQLLADPWSSSEQWSPAAAGSPCIHRDDSSSLVGSEFNDSLAGYGADSPDYYRDIFSENSQSAYKYVSDPKTNTEDLDWKCNFDSLYSRDSEKQSDTHALFSGTSGAQGCTTPYKNIEVMMTYSDGINADSLYSERRSHADESSIKARMSKELPPLPTCYLYHPKNCPLHRGAPPRLSPIGALSPPQRSGAPSLSCLNSPLFPRSHTLPALAAPLYYPNLYPPIPPSAPPLPPKFYQGPRQPHVSTVRSVSFAGSVLKTDDPWMGEDVDHPVRGLSLTSLCLQEKKALVSGVSAAVEAILAQFSSSRTVVQKALSGDSTINPSLGRVVLQCLCPALHNLLTDGLKPHQSDLIAGRRPNSAWSLVQATTRTGPKTQALFNLQIRVGELPQLRQSKQRFNAFLLGLLNTKLLDFWLSHLQTCCDVLEAYYHPTSFMRLSLSSCRPLFEELLLVLQPLSLLTFNLDLLFQHHHLEADDHRPEMLRSPQQEAGLQQSLTGQQKTTAGGYIETLSEVTFGSPEHSENTNSSPISNGRSESSLGTDSEPVKASVSFGQTSPQLLWVQEKEIETLPLPNVEEDSFTHQAGQVIQQGWGAVVRWGGRLSQNLADFSLSAVKKEETKASSADIQDQAGSDSSSVSETQVPWNLGRLFGASRSPHSPTGHMPPTRRPSQWLAPGVTALTRMVSSSSSPTLRGTSECHEGRDTESEKKTDSTEMMERPRQYRSVRTLCDHSGTGSELSFCKGEELVVLGGVDQDWIRCRQGDKEGLVPIGYTSLIM